MLGTLTPIEIEQLLQRQLIGRIGCHADGVTFVVPIAYAYDGDYIYGHSPEGMKTRLMRRNPKVCLEIDEITSLSNWKSVVLQGEYEELFGEAARKAYNFFMDKLKPHLPASAGIPSYGMAQFHQKEQSSVQTIVFRIRIREKAGRFEKLR